MAGLLTEIGKFLAAPLPPPPAFREFGNTLGVSFEANLANSVLLTLGNFTGAFVHGWSEKESRRVTGVLSETKAFQHKTFQKKLDEAEQSYKSRSIRLNWVAVAWAVTAAIVDVLLLIVLPFYSDQKIDALAASEALVFLFSAIPFGAIGIMILLALARHRMKALSREFDTVLDYAKEAVTARIDETLEFLNAKETVAADAKGAVTARIDETLETPKDPDQQS